ncbi:MAG: cob(I)yrinic acid a,c-diamide adenosyltransferase [Coriobacteriaceae bacterium]|nr:cob(I)yrinic acid a,c-diamide adenosyltransferase [Coriobacteriaceae bacterium]
MNRLECGRVQIYTGDGKGKTTAALGLALRALGYDLDVLMLQFAKKLRCAEHAEADRMGLALVQAEAATPGERADEIMDRARAALSGKDEAGRPVDVLILDELGEAMRRGFVTRSDVEELIALKPPTTELVLTGRGLLPLADLADLVTEMVPHKHYFDEGLLARRGIEY